MKNKLPHLTLMLFFLIATNLVAQEENKDHSLYLLSNLENLSATAPELDAIQAVLEKENNDFTILINGDFVDRNGLGVKPEEGDLDKLDRLINIVGEKGRVVFIPGDREWDNGGKRGLKKVKALERYLESKLGKGKVIYPQGGCLGPEVIDIGDKLRIVAVNTQWFVEEEIGPEEEDADCGLLNETEFWFEIEDLMGDSENRNVVIAGHHPVLSYGQYAGYKLGKQHLWPPIVGTFIASYHQGVGGKKDLTQKNLKHYSSRAQGLIQRYPGCIFVSGHEHDTQLLYEDGTYHINSGAIAEGRPVGRGEQTIYRQKKAGFAKLVFENDGSVVMNAYEISNRKDIKSTYVKELFSSPCGNVKTNILTNRMHIPCIGEVSTEPSTTEGKTTATVIAGEQYKGNFFKNTILGKHYRTTWAQPISNMPYLDLDTVHGGLAPYSKGGGAQTVSLKFKSGDGQIFAFRSVNKTPTKRMDKDLKPGLFGYVTQDKTSHQHPFSSTILGPMMDSLDLPHSMPKLYLMPDSPKLGVFREEFAGMFGTLELKPKGKKKKRAGFEGADDVESTMQVYRKLIDDNDNKIDVEKFVRARIFDIWVSDWDRHFNNYKWLAYEDGKKTTYTPFPKDRDKALSLYQGVYWLIEVFHIQKDKTNFRKNFYGLKYLNFKNKTMDRWLANTYDAADWEAAVNDFVNTMSDEAIAEGIANLPPEAQGLVRERITEVLQARRKKLPEVMKRYYKKLAKYIDLMGSNSRELFEMTRLENGDVQATIYKLKKSGKKGKKIYDRLIKRKETKEIRLHGLGKKDQFLIKGEANKSILIRVMGGKGADQVEDQSKVRGLKKMTKVYDKRGQDELKLGKEAKKENTHEILSFESDNFFNYNYFKIFPVAGYNADDGFILGVNGNYVKQGFDKPDFAQKYNYNASMTTRGNYNFGLNATYRHVIHKWDGLVGISLASVDRSFRNFYGLSNENVINHDLRDDDFYENDMSSLNANLGLTRTFMNKSSFAITAVVDARDVEVEAEEGEPSAYDGIDEGNGLGKTTLFGPQLKLNIDMRNSGTLPTKGLQFKAANFTFFNTDESFGRGGRFSTDLSVFFTTGVRVPVTLGLRGGAISSYGDVPFYYKAYLGQQGNFRGFLKNRFGGDTAAYLNTDLRFNFGDVVTKVVPFQYGIFGLFDTGRTWREGESSDRLHYAYGGGIFIVPYVESYNLTFTGAQNNDGDFLFTFQVGFFLR
ncbi:MAG: hypothetical protein ACI9VN_002634 [Patescibacteria group bacterium]|jgi:hypothetical protein